MIRLLARLGFRTVQPTPPPPARLVFRLDTCSPESRAMYAAAFRLVDDVLRAGK